MRSHFTARLILTSTAVMLAGSLVACSSGTSASSDASSGRWAKEEGTIVFGAVPDQAGSDSNSKPLEDYISTKTGYKVEYYPTTDYTSLVAAATAGKIDVMNSGALQYVQAANKGARIEPVAATLTSPDAKEAGYYSVAVAPADSPINDLKGAKGKTVCFVDPNSTSGFLFGLYQLGKAGLNVEPSGTDANGNPQFSDFKAHFAGAHDKAAQSVMAGQCDLGFSEDVIANPLIEKGNLKELTKEFVPGGPLSVSQELPEEARTKVTETLRSASPENIKAAGVEMTPGFVESFFGVKPVDKSYYEPIFELCGTISAAKCEQP